MDKFEQKKIKKIKPIKNTCYDLLINYIPQPIKNVRAVLKMKLLVFFKTNTPKQTVCRRRKKLSKPKAQSKINNIRNPFMLKKKKKKLKME